MMRTRYTVTVEMAASANATVKMFSIRERTEKAIEITYAGCSSAQLVTTFLLTKMTKGASRFSISLDVLG